MKDIDLIFERTVFSNIDLPEFLYKYRSWGKEEHKRILTHRELYFASPISFEDEFDCKIPIRHDLLTNEEIYENYLILSKRNNPYYSQRQHQQDARKWLKRGIMRNKKELKEKDKAFFERFNDNLGILCLTAVPDNYEMWNSTYADFGKGFCIGFNTKSLFEFSENFGGSGGKVNYYEELPIIKGIENPKKQYILQIYSKLKKYEKEREYRVAKYNVQNRQKIIPSEIFSEIIIGDKMPTEMKNEIIELSKQKFPHAKISIAYLDEKNNVVTMQKAQ